MTDRCKYCKFPMVDLEFKDNSLPSYTRLPMTYCAVCKKVKGKEVSLY